MTIPDKLYKYCPVSQNSLSSALNAKLYYSLPTGFNDPLDCNPSIVVDIDSHKMIALLEKVMADDGCVKSQIGEEINRIYYFSTEVELFDDIENYEKVVSYNIATEVRRRLRFEYGAKGVLALTESWNNPLLWSHYAAQHQGICIEYNVDKRAADIIRPVNYRAPRSIFASDMFAWKCENNEESRKKVYDTYFYAKAPQWDYEKEWRIVNEKSGVRQSDLSMSAIYFGMKVSPVWKWMLAKTLNSDQDVILYEVFADEATFDLQRREVERGELESRGINRPAFSAFENFMTEEEIAGLTVGERAVKNINLKV